MDLDQALHIERDGDGYVVHYAIADVAAFVDARRPDRRGGAPARRDAVRRRTRKVPLHPTGALRGRGLAAARPGPPGAAVDDRPRRDGRGHRRARRAGAGAQPRQARLRRRAAATSTPGSADELLRPARGGRRAAPAARGRPRRGVACRCPSRRSTSTATGGRSSSARMLPVEEWNAQISLLTGMAAASLMVYARVGLLRTLPPPDPRDVQRLHRTAKALRIDVAGRAASTPTSSASLDPDAAPATPRCSSPAPGCCAASGYVAFDGELPEQPEHAALASEYAHVTAPLRRLVDRYAGEVCVALCAGDRGARRGCWSGSHGLPETMQASGQRAHRYERAVLDLVEAAVLHAARRRDVRRGGRPGRRQGPDPGRRRGPASPRSRPGCRAGATLPLGDDVEATAGRGRPAHPHRALRASERAPDGALDWAGG